MVEAPTAKQVAGRATAAWDDLSLDESFFPVMWGETGYPTPWLAEHPDID